ncbi:GPP34 family phosphoprotein [Kineococcus sp. DHX-1]|uniref:GOLPH3/VPS74 family protein n=1 Tax=Kineococcus sp. DHX-1 TaxID=3349638 RepID=UPI0036D2AA4F
MDALSDDLVLVLLDPHSGRPLVDSTRARAVIGGAVLLDLALRERLVAEPARWGGDKLQVADPSPTGDPVLDHAVSRLGSRRTAASTAVTRVAGGRTAQTVRERLAARGAVRHEPGGFLRFARDHPDPAVREPLVAAVAAALQGTRPVTVRTAALVSLVHSVGAVGKVVPGHGWSRKELDARVASVAKTLDEGHWAGSAVAAAVRSAQAAVTAAIVASTSAATAGGASS